LKGLEYILLTNFQTETFAKLGLFKSSEIHQNVVTVLIIHYLNISQRP